MVGKLTSKEEAAQRYWKASLAWHDREGWAIGWTQQSFIDECRVLCTDYGNVGRQADQMLDDMIYGRELHSGDGIEFPPAEVIPIMDYRKQR